MKIEKEDFDSWRDHPITQEVMRAFDLLGEKAKEKWLAASWGRGQCDPLLLADLKARAEVVQDFREITFEDLEEWLDADSEGSTPVGA